MVISRIVGKLNAHYQVYSPVRLMALGDITYPDFMFTYFRRIRSENIKKIRIW